MPEQQQYGEKYEKEAEKREKEREKEEKTWDEKWRHDPLGSALWAIVLIWAGSVFFVDQMGLLDRIVEGLDAWGVVLAGAGVIMVVGIVIRLLVPAYRKPITGDAIIAALLLGAGLSAILETALVWPLILIVLGVVILVRGLGR